MEVHARAKTRAFQAAARWRRFHVPRRFQRAQAPFSLPKPTSRAAPGKPLIFHDFAARMPETQNGLAPVYIIS